MTPVIQTQKAFTRGKEFGRPCEDYVLGWQTQARYALCDGASISYDSRGWARALCWRFMRDPYFGPDWLEVVRMRFSATSAPPSDDWSAAHAFDRGSFASFLGFTITPQLIKIHAVGDTVLFVIRPNERIVMIPDIKSEDFGRDPILLCSRPNRSAFPDDDEAFEMATYLVDAPALGWAGTRLVAVSDALAEWIARSQDDVGKIAKLSELSGISDRKEFLDWVLKAVADRRVRNDDCTVLKLNL
jgi:hypothetical protein